MPGAFDTPPTATRVKPGLDEMHPSKVHQTTAEPETLPTTTPPSKSATGPLDQTPSKTRISLPPQMSSPGFEFSFSRPQSDLSEEAQKIMDSVRQEAARIKAQLQVERDKQKEKDGETSQLFGATGRKIAKPRSGRYSEIHKEQFRKMDSITDHASTWKHKSQAATTSSSLNRSESKPDLNDHPITPSKTQSLKRSNSKAGFDKGDGSIPRSKSFNGLSNQIASTTSKRLENLAPGKRVKRNHDDDAATARRVLWDTPAESAQGVPSKSQYSALPSAITTPTRASLACAASIQGSKTSKIPSLSRSASTKTIRIPKTEGSNKYFSSLARFSPIKSILRRPQPKFSGDPVKVAAGTHLPAPSKLGDFLKDLPSLPSTPTPVEKHVNFTASTDKLAAAPFLSRSKIPRSESTVRVVDHAISAIDSPNVNQRNTHKIPNTASVPGTNPGDFTFSSSKTIDFGPATSGLKSPPSNSTIRPVRPSGFPTPLAETAFENPGKGIPHGITNKKRKHDRETHDDYENTENRPPGSTEGSPTKRVKVERKRSVLPETPKKKTGMVGQKSTGKKGKGVLSLSRLNALARPKQR